MAPAGRRVHEWIGVQQAGPTAQNEWIGELGLALGTSVDCCCCGDSSGPSQLSSPSISSLCARSVAVGPQGGGPGGALVTAWRGPPVNFWAYSTTLRYSTAVRRACWLAGRPHPYLPTYLYEEAAGPSPWFTRESLLGQRARASLSPPDGPVARRDLPPAWPRPTPSAGEAASSSSEVPDAWALCP